MDNFPPTYPIELRIKQWQGYMEFSKSLWSTSFSPHSRDNGTYGRDTGTDWISNVFSNSGKFFQNWCQGSFQSSVEHSIEHRVVDPTKAGLDIKLSHYTTPEELWALPLGLPVKSRGLEGGFPKISLCSSMWSYKFLTLRAIFQVPENPFFVLC